MKFFFGMIAVAVTVSMTGCGDSGQKIKTDPAVKARLDAVSFRCSNCRKTAERGRIKWLNQNIGICPSCGKKGKMLSVRTSSSPGSARSRQPDR